MAKLKPIRVLVIFLALAGLSIPRPGRAQVEPLPPSVPTTATGPGLGDLHVGVPVSSRGEHLNEPLVADPGQRFPGVWAGSGFPDTLLALMRRAPARSLLLLEPKADDACNPMKGRASECMSHFKVAGGAAAPDSAWWAGLLDLLARPDTLLTDRGEGKHAKDFRPDVGARFLEPGSGSVVEVLFSFRNHELMVVRSGYQVAAGLRGRAKAMYEHLAKALPPGALPATTEWPLARSVLLPGDTVQSAPVLKYLAHAKYPEVAYRLRRDGRVVLDVLIGVEGRAERVVIAETTGAEFNEAALDALEECDFRSAMHAGHPVPCWVTLPIQFHYN